MKGMRTLSDICVSKVVKAVVDNDWLWDWFVLIFAVAIQVCVSGTNQTRKYWSLMG